MFTAMGYGVYFFFASLMILSAIFVFFLLPETKGVPLESMDRLFSSGLNTRTAQKVVMAELLADEEHFRHNVEGSDFGLTKEKPSEVENV